jgi:signal peptidase
VPLEPKALLTVNSPGALDPAHRHEATCELVVDTLARFGTVRLKTLGRSMLPAIWPGDVLTIEHVGAAHLVPADVVLYRRESRLFAHRLLCDVGQDPRAVLTKGDAHVEPDPLVPAGDALGRVTAIERGPFRLDPRRPVGSVWRLLRAVVDAGLRCRRAAARVVRVCRFTISPRRAFDGRRIAGAGPT